MIEITPSNAIKYKISRIREAMRRKRPKKNHISSSTSTDVGWFDVANVRGFIPTKTFFFGNSHSHKHSGRLKLIATLLVLLEHRRSKYALRLGVL